MNTSSQFRTLACLAAMALLSCNVANAETFKRKLNPTTGQVPAAPVGKLPVLATATELTASECEKLGGKTVHDALNVCASHLVCTVSDQNWKQHQVCLEVTK